MATILITGAAGRIGAALRTGLADTATTLRLSDLKPIDRLAPRESFHLADLRDFAAVRAAVAGSDAVVHLGGIPIDDTFENILDHNIRGTYHVYEAARLEGARRVVFASSNHAIGMHERTTALHGGSDMRPDGFYGLGKAYGELLARTYWDKHGIESACLRIGSFLERPVEPRNLATWISVPDLIQLVRRCLEVPKLGYAVLYGCSDNRRSWWSNAHRPDIGYAPRDDAERFAAELYAKPIQADPVAERFQGGPFASAGYTRKG